VEALAAATTALRAQRTAKDAARTATRSALGRAAAALAGGGSREHAPRLLVSQTVPLLTEEAYKSPNAFKKPSLLRDIRAVAARNVTRPSDA
jgi:hypothetical protein